MLVLLCLSGRDNYLLVTLALMSETWILVYNTWNELTMSSLPDVVGMVSSTLSSVPISLYEFISFVLS